MSNMSNASNNVLDISTSRTKRVALPSSCATASRESKAAAAAPERSKAQTKPQRGCITQPTSKRSKAPPKAPITKAIVDTPIPEASGSESEEQEPEDNDKSLGPIRDPGYDPVRVGWVRLEKSQIEMTGFG